MDIGSNIKSDISSADELISNYVYDEGAKNIENDLRYEIKSFMWITLEDVHSQMIRQINRSTDRKIRTLSQNQ